MLMYVVYVYRDKQEPVYLCVTDRLMCSVRQFHYFILYFCIDYFDLLV